MTMPPAPKNTGALCNTRGNSTEPSRKRRRQAVVCTECRRRKIACDRNVPCAQCIQSKSTCTFYNSYNSYSDGDQARTVPNGQRVSQPVSTPANGQTAYANQTGPQLSLVPMTDDQNLFTCTTRPSPISAGPALLTHTSGTTTMDVLPFSMTMYPDPDDVQFPASLFSEMSGVNGTTNMTDLTPMSTESPVRSPTSTLTDSGTVFHKSRVYGPSHWMSLLNQHDLFDDIKSTLFTGEANTMLLKCKSLARAIKSSSRPNMQLLSRPLLDLMPNKETADRLVQLYLRTFESVFSIMHVSTFQQEYVEHWNNPQASKEPFLIQLLLIMAIGTCFCPAPSAAGSTKARSKLRDQSLQWIYATHARLTSPMVKQDLSLCGTQNHCLLLLALMTDTQAIGGDLTWIAMGSLMQRAMAIGLHIKPSQLPVSALEAEMRRRIWITILELSVQSSLDSGTYPIIPRGAPDNFEPPSNLDDSQLTASTQKQPVPQPPNTFTRSSIQCALLKSLPIRFKIAEAISQPPYKLTYENVRSMGTELTAHLRETSKLIKSFHFTRPSPFQIHLQDLLARRFLFTLHVQFVHRAPSNINFHFSRTACLESALLLLGPSFSRSAEDSKYPDDDNGMSSSLNDYQNLRLHGDGLFKNVLLAAVMAVCAELLIQLREDSSPSASSFLRMPLLKAIKDTSSLMWRRIQRGETSIKAFVFVTCVLAKIDASRHRNSPHQKNQIDQAVADTAKHVLNVCDQSLASRLDGLSTPSSWEPDENFAPKEQIIDLEQWLPFGDRSESGESVLQNSVSTNTRSDHADDMSMWLNDDTSVWTFPAWGNEPMFI